jgi:hypothetical protein
MSILWRRESSGIICFDIETAKRQGKDWEDYLVSSRYNLSPHVAPMFSSQSFPASNGRLIKVRIIPGQIFSRDSVSIEEVLNIGFRYRFIKPPASLAPDMRAILSDGFIGEIGFDKLFVMHEPIQDNNYLLALRSDISNYLYAFDINPRGGFRTAATGFAFEAP